MACQLPGTLDKFAPQGTKLLEPPQRCAFFGGVSFLGITVHLHFPVEVMRQHGREKVDLIAGFFAGRHVVHLCLISPQPSLKSFEYKLILLSCLVTKYWISIIRNKGGNCFPILAA